MESENLKLIKWEEFFGFEVGGTLYERHVLVDGFCWRGELPKVVPPGSSPSTCGGIGHDAWIYIGHRL